MALYIIGLGLWDEKDISLKGMEAISRCRTVYLENYTSRMNCATRDLERLFNKKIILAGRELVENQTSKMIGEAKSHDVAFLVPGAPLAATTHIELYLEARRQGIDVRIIENASVMTAVGVTGLFLYKFGKTSTIPMENKTIISPFETLQKNLALGLHTLFLLDIKDGKMMTAREGLDYLIRLGLSRKQLCVACGGLGSDKPEIKVGAAGSLIVQKMPQVLIVPGKLHFKEEEVLKLYQV